MAREIDSDGRYIRARERLILPYTPFGGGPKVSGIYHPGERGVKSKDKRVQKEEVKSKIAAATSGTAASRAAQERVRLRRIEKAKRYDSVDRRRVAPTVSPGTRERLIGEISEPDYPKKKPPVPGDPIPKIRAITVPFTERDPSINIETIKPVYPLTNPVDAAYETEYGAGKALKAGVNPIRSKYMDINISENKQRTARITRTAEPITQAFDRRELEVQWSGDRETPAQKAAKKRNERARVKAASAAVDATFPRPSSAPGFEYTTPEPPQVALDIEAEKARRVAFEARALRIKEARVRGGSPVYGPKPQPVRVPRPVVRKSNEQIKIDAEKSAAASSGATKYRYPPIISTETPGPTIVGDASKIPPGVSAWRNTFGSLIQPFGGIFPNKPSTIARIGKAPTKILGATTKAPVVTNPSDLLAQYLAAGRAARAAKQSDVRFLRGKSVGSFPGTTNKPRLPEF